MREQLRSHAAKITLLGALLLAGSWIAEHHWLVPNDEIARDQELTDLRQIILDGQIGYYYAALKSATRQSPIDTAEVLALAARAIKTMSFQKFLARTQAHPENADQAWLVREGETRLVDSLVSEHDVRALVYSVDSYGMRFAIEGKNLKYGVRRAIFSNTKWRERAGAVVTLSYLVGSLLTALGVWFAQWPAPGSPTEGAISPSSRKVKSRP